MGGIVAFQDTTPTRLNVGPYSNFSHMAPDLDVPSNTRTSNSVHIDKGALDRRGDSQRIQAQHDGFCS